MVVLSPNYHLVTLDCICRLGVSIPLVAVRCHSERGGGGGLRNKQIMKLIVRIRRIRKYTCRQTHVLVRLVLLGISCKCIMLT